MSVETELRFGVGSYWTIEGYMAHIDAITPDGQLVGRVNIQTDLTRRPIWNGVIWDADGYQTYRGPMYQLVHGDPPPAIKQKYWVNIYPSGPGQLRKNWEEALIEASRSEEEPLCRVEVKVDARAGDGLR